MLLSLCRRSSSSRHQRCSVQRRTLGEYGLSVCLTSLDTNLEVTSEEGTDGACTNKIEFTHGAGDLRIRGPYSEQHTSCTVRFDCELGQYLGVDLSGQDRVALRPLGQPCEAVFYMESKYPASGDEADVDDDYSDVDLKGLKRLFKRVDRDDYGLISMQEAFGFCVNVAEKSEDYCSTEGRYYFKCDLDGDRRWSLDELTPCAIGR